MKLVRPIKMCLNVICNKVHVGEYFYNAFPIQDGLKLVDILSPFLYTIRKVQAIRRAAT
jgi:hypothetical protein